MKSGKRRDLGRGERAATSGPDERAGFSPAAIRGWGRGGHCRSALLFAAVFAALQRLAHGTDISATWSFATNGDWTDGTKWSTPNFPNNGTPSGALYAVTVDASRSAYAVTLDSDIAVDSFTLNSADATLNQNSGTFSFNTVTLSAGAYHLNSGTMAGGTISQAGGTFTVQNATLSGVNLTGGDLQATGTLIVQNGITIANRNLDLASGASLHFDGTSQSVNNLNITPSAFANIYASGPTSGGPQTLTLGGNVTVHGGAQFNNYNAGDGLINNGIINADNSAAATEVGLDNFTNANVAEATGGGILNIQSANWKNTGTISATGGGVVYLGGTASGSNVGNLSTDSTGVIHFNGTVNDGTVNVGGGNISASGATFNGVSIAGGDLQVSSSLYVQNGITIANRNLDLASGASLHFDGTSQSVNNLNITPSAFANIYASGPTSGGPQTLTLGGSVTVHGGAQFNNYNAGDGLINNGIINADSGYYYNTSIDLDRFTNNGTVEATNGGALYIASANWTNPGTISANQGVVTLSGNWTNTGTIAATNSSTVNLSGNFTTPQIGSINADSSSTVNITGTVDNTNATLGLAGGGTLLLASGGTITKGAVNVASGNFTVQNGTLNAVSITGGDLQVNGNLYVQNGITIANRNLDLASGASLHFDGTSQSVNNLNITPSAFANIYASGPTSGGPQTLTLGGNVTVHGGAQFNNYNAGDTLINNGIINADSGYYYNTSIDLDNFTNNGTVEATNGATLYIGSANWTSFGTISANQGAVTLSGNWTNSGAITATNSSTLSLSGNWTNDGTIAASNSSTVNLGGNFTTQQIRSLTADSSSSVAITGYLDNTNATLNPTNYGGTWTLASGGTITKGAVNVAGGNFTVQNGTLNAVSITGGDLQVNGNLYVQNGVTIANHNLDLASGASLHFDGTSQSVNNLNITPSAFANIYASGPTSGGPQTLTLGGNVTVHGGAQFNNYNAGDGLINKGVINADSGYYYNTSIDLDNFTNNGAAEATGGGTLAVTSPNFVNHGTIAIHNGILDVPHGLNVNDGILTGSGTIYGNVTLSNGTFGTTTTLNSNAQPLTSPSTLAFQLRSADDYDSLTVNGNMTLGGNLHVTLASGFTPINSDVFVLDTSGVGDSLLGSFLNVADGGQLETSDDTGFFTVEYADRSYPNEVVLTGFRYAATPEPAAGVLVLGAIAPMLLSRRRRDRRLMAAAGDLTLL